MQSQDKELISLLQQEFPAVDKNIISNEVRKNKGDLEGARVTVQSISDSIAEADAILGEEGKEYQASSSDDDSVKSDYESQDEDEQAEIDEICKPKVDNFMEETKEIVEANSQEIYEDLGKDLADRFPGVPQVCVEECIKYFYPNMGKIELVLGEFQKQWVMYQKDYDGYKKGKGSRKERVRKERKPKKDRRGKNNRDAEINPELAKEIAEIEEFLDNDMNDLSNQEKKDMRGKLKGLKKEMRGLRKEFKRKEKDERRALKDEAKKLKREQREKNKKEKRLKREEETKARSQKDYEDDVFFREIREEPTIIKQYLKEAKKALRKAEKKGTEEEVKFYTNKVEEYEKSLESETDKAIMLTYERYNKPEEASTRLDLHGLRKKEAVRLLEKILAIRVRQIEAKHGPKESREPVEFNIVTGRGNHSARPVLKMAVKDYLLDNKIEYEEFKNNAGYTAML